MRHAALAFLAFALAACASEPSQSDAAGLALEKIVIDTASGPKPFTVEIAATPDSQERGLMYRTQMAPDAGMLFDFRHSQMASFWMKNTILPLDMLFVRQDGTISTITADAKPYSLDIISSLEPVRAVIEINGGRAKALGIAAGDKVHAGIFGNAPFLR